MKTANVLALCLSTLLSLTSCDQQDLRPPQDGEQNTVVTATESKAIIGSDNRESTDYIAYVNRDYTKRVGQLLTKVFLDETRYRYSICTATVIGRRYIITAAHCAFDEDGELLKDQFFYPGIRKENTSPNSKYRVNKVYMPQNYRAGSVDPENDMAVMELDLDSMNAPAGSYVGTMGYWGNDDFNNERVLTLGYPGDKRLSTQYFETDCYSNIRSGKELTLDCDVITGQSGSPILIYHKGLKEHFVAGVITSSGSYTNYGSHMNKEREKIIKQIIAGTYHPQNFTEKWRTLSVRKSNLVKVFVKNTCSGQDLYVAYRYKNLDDEWSTEGFKVLKYGEDIEFFNTRNGVYYLGVTRKNGNFLTTRDTTKYLPAHGGDVPLQKFHKTEFGVYTHNYYCR